jgi:hypothetical protein
MWHSHSATGLDKGGGRLARRPAVQKGSKPTAQLECKSSLERSDDKEHLGGEARGPDMRGFRVVGWKIRTAEPPASGQNIAS